MDKTSDKPKMTGPLPLRELQKEFVRVLSDFHDLCEKHGLRYVMSYGTLIGAVRHKGFIPWDDDIDICMPREDYEKLRLVMDDDRYRLFDCRSDPEYHLAFDKFSDTKTWKEVLPFQKHDLGMGVYVDVIPVETFHSKKVLRRWLKRLHHLNRKRSFSIRPYYKPFSFINMLKNMVLRFYHGKINKYAVRTVKGLIKASHAKGPDNFLACGVFAYDTIEGCIFPNDTFDNRILMDFEGKKFYAPAAFDAVLRAAYGDYMTIPPVEERIAHNFKYYRLN